MEWEIRQTATPGMVNGGGFDPVIGVGSTDYSLQDAAQINPTDLTTSGAGSTTLTSAAAGFTSIMVGNVINITAGTNFQTGRYMIASFTDASNVVLDRTPTSGGAGTGGTGYVGGALSLNSTLDDDWGETLLAGQTVWVRYNASVIALGESFALAAAGTAANVITFEGYTTTHGDLAGPGVVLTSSNTPTIACGSSFQFTTGAFTNVKFINFAGSSTGVLLFGSNCKVIGCRAVNSSPTSTRTAISAGTSNSVIRCEAISYRGYGIVNTGGGAFSVLYSYAHDCDVGIRVTSTPSYRFTGNISSANVTAAIQLTGASPDVHILHNTLYGQPGTGGIGISLATGITNVVVMNNIIMGFTRGVVHADVQTAGVDDYNCYRDNNLANTNWATGPNNTSNDPAFTDIVAIQFTDGTTSGSILTSAASDFSAVVDNVDFLYLSGGTGVIVGKYLITAHTPTTLTLDIAPGTDATADKVGAIVTGGNFLPTGNI